VPEVAIEGGHFVTLSSSRRRVRDVGTALSAEP
jgi:hypothetical protein